MIFYRDNYKLQLAETAYFRVPYALWPAKPIETEFINLDIEGMLTIKAGYAWDGASGPTIDRPRAHVITPSLVHDAFCQIIRQRHLCNIDARLHADKYFHQLLRERGMNRLRAWIWYRGVRFGAKHNEQQPKEILESP